MKSLLQAATGQSRANLGQPANSNIEAQLEFELFKRGSSTSGELHLRPGYIDSAMYVQYCRS